MGETIVSFQKLNKEVQQLLKIPAAYVVFAFAVVKYLYSSDLSRVTLKLFVGKNLQKLVLQAFNFVYSFDIIRIVSITFAILSILILFGNEAWKKVGTLPQEKNMIDRTTVFWSATIAAKKPLRFLKKYFTSYWTWYFSIHVFLDAKIFESNNIRQRGFWLCHVVVNGAPTMQFNPSSILLFLNIGMLMYYCGVGLFKNRGETQYWSIDKTNQGQFECLDSIQVRDSTVLLLKPRYLRRAKRDIYLIAQGNSTFLKVIDTSHNFDEIRFHFENIENERAPLDGSWYI